MSPEQARGEAVDHRSDLFSLGSVMYAMCTGRPPFRAESSYGILRRITDSEPRPIREINPGIPIWLCAVIEKLHAKSPNDRYQSAGDVAELLGQCLAHVQQPDTQALPETLVRGGRCSYAGLFPRLRLRFISLCQARTGRLWKAVLQRPRTTIAGIAMLAVVALVAITQIPWNVARRGAQDATMTSDAGRPAVGGRAGSGDPRTSEGDPLTASTESPFIANDLDPATNWHNVAGEVRQLSQQADEFMLRVDRLWDDIPPSVQEHQPVPAVETPSFTEESDR